MTKSNSEAIHQPVPPGAPPGGNPVLLAHWQHWVDESRTAEQIHHLLRHYGPLQTTVPQHPDPGGVTGPTPAFPYAYDPYLARCLLSHLRFEFPDIPWPEDWPQLRQEDITDQLLDKLEVAAWRRTFVGVCDICRQWQETPAGPPAALETSDVVEHFLDSRRGSIDEKSLTSYRHTLGAFAKHCPQLPSRPEELEAYFGRFRERRSAASAYSPIKQLYEFASERLGFPNPMKQVKRPRYKEKEPYSLTLDEARAVVDACHNERELGLIHLYLGHGFRLDEACRVNVGDVLDGQIMVRGKERTEYLPLLPETRDILLRLANGSSPQEAIFTSWRGRRLCHKETYNVVKAILKRAGVTEGKDGQRIATHTLRKTFATLATHAGCNDRIVKRLLRHKTADITSLYVSMPMETLRANLEHYSPIRLLNGQSKDELHKIFNCSI